MAPKKAPPPVEPLTADAIAAIDAELRMLQLEEARDAAAKRRNQRNQQVARREDTEAALREYASQKQQMEEDCPHLKGGMDAEGLFNGSDRNHSVIKHTDNLGRVMVVCQRCGASKSRPEPKEFESKDAYMEALREYRRWLAMPTDNKPSGTQMFAIERDAA